MPDRSAEKPPHVPDDCVADVDIYQLSGAEHDLHAAWKHLQDTAPSGFIWTPRNGGHWIVTRGADIARIYGDHENFSSNITIVPRELGERFPLRPTTIDPPGHRAYRRILTAALSSKLVRRAQPLIEDFAISEISRLKTRGHCEFITDFAVHLPIRVFFHLAELPLEEIEMIPRYGAEPFGDDPTSFGEPVMERFADYLRPYVVERQQAPGDDLLSCLVCGPIDGRALTVDEGVDLSTAVLTGGLDTVISTLGFMMAFLARHPGHRQRLRDEPLIMATAVEEMLRRFPIMTKARLIRGDQEIRGVTLKDGEMIVLPPLHGLDEREFANAMTVDFDRPSASDSTFGNGVHRCPGALLARSECEIVLREWLAQIPDFHIDPCRLPTMQAGILGAMTSLGLQWNAACHRSSPAPGVVGGFLNQCSVPVDRS
jgi:cytochrome P450